MAQQKKFIFLTNANFFWTSHFLFHWSTYLICSLSVFRGSPLFWCLLVVFLKRKTQAGRAQLSQVSQWQVSGVQSYLATYVKILFGWLSEFSDWSSLAIWLRLSSNCLISFFLLHFYYFLDFFVFFILPRWIFNLHSFTTLSRLMHSLHSF